MLCIYCWLLLAGGLAAFPQFPSSLFNVLAGVAHSLAIWPQPWHLRYWSELESPHDTTGYQPYELMFGCKAQTICDAWLWLAIYNDNFLQSKCAWVNQQHELILAGNRWALKRIKTSAGKSVSQTGEKALKIPLGNLVFLHDHPECQNKIQVNYKSELFVME